MSRKHHRPTVPAIRSTCAKQRLEGFPALSIRTGQRYNMKQTRVLWRQSVSNNHAARDRRILYPCSVLGSGLRLGLGSGLRSGCHSPLPYRYRLVFVLLMYTASRYRANRVLKDDGLSAVYDAMPAAKVSLGLRAREEGHIGYYCPTITTLGKSINYAGTGGVRWT